MFSLYMLENKVIKELLNLLLESGVHYIGVSRERLSAATYTVEHSSCGTQIEVVVRIRVVSGTPEAFKVRRNDSEQRYKDLCIISNTTQQQW